ncbi:MAG: transposase [candidate division KSB1 bacterium]|nr:transposase [candidate division KSB1 bacterium]MDZ7273161.1 transposase [candidate division KSB1 bacterium]MDZ7285263.1 transposase [candidate division KSB1 bacterium]MDZ7298295.1 transposase [candidate division KSB1 bacterium]MDZ7306624.1 transposase [candidate division KSB1 bacterium]
MSKNRRNFTPSFKAQVVLEVLSGVRSAAEVCREYQINPQLFSQWKSHLLNNAASLFDGATRRSAEQARIEELERVLGQKTLEAEILKKASNILQTHLTRSGRS